MHDHMHLAGPCFIIYSNLDFERNSCFGWFGNECLPPGWIWHGYVLCDRMQYTHTHTRAHTLSRSSIRSFIWIFYCVAHLNVPVCVVYIASVGFVVCCFSLFFSFLFFAIFRVFVHVTYAAVCQLHISFSFVCCSSNLRFFGSVEITAI